MFNRQIYVYQRISIIKDGFIYREIKQGVIRIERSPFDKFKA